MLPGSRQNEVRSLAATYVETARRLYEQFPQALFLVPLISRQTRDLFEQEIYRCKAQGSADPYHVFGHAHAIIAADVVLIRIRYCNIGNCLLKRPDGDYLQGLKVTYR